MRIGYQTKGMRCPLERIVVNNGKQQEVRNTIEVRRADLPLHCPQEDKTLWSSHPRVYLPIEATGQAKCPYCGADYVLRD